MKKVKGRTNRKNKREQREMTTDWKNKLYFGDNLEIMREHIPVESVDLIYLDPPFNSKATYNVLFAEKNGTESRAQITAFEDTWHWGLEAEQAYREVTEKGPRRLADLIGALRQFLGTNDMMAYLVMMAPRLVEMHRVLKPTGSIYLHCDPTASHYLKLVMDAVFGVDNFRNEIIWKRDASGKGGKTISRQWPRIYDSILFYSKTDNWFFEKQFTGVTPLQIKEYHYKDPDGRKFKRTSLGNYTEQSIKELENKGLIYVSSTGNKYKKYYLDEAKVTVDSIWADIFGFGVITSSKERLGYPTQKPEALLERIIKASSNEGDLVMDPFCGCGTTIAVAERLNRRWIGMDITHLAISLMQRRLEDTFGTELSPYEIVGDPKDLHSAEALAEQNRYQFQWWALSKVGAWPVSDKKKGADRGIDGIINFIDTPDGKVKKIIVQVKSGHIDQSHIATLRGDIEREGAVIGAFITLHPPTAPMREEAITVGFYEPEFFPGKRFPRLQILTIEELLNGKQLEYPRMGPEVTFKKAERKEKGKIPEQMKLE